MSEIKEKKIKNEEKKEKQIEDNNKIPGKLEKNKTKNSGKLLFIVLR